MAHITIKGQRINYPAPKDLGARHEVDEPPVISKSRRGSRVIALRMSLETGSPEFWAECIGCEHGRQQAIFAPISTDHVLALFDEAKTKYLVGHMQGRIADVLMEEVCSGAFDPKAAEDALVARSA